jgi:hypothetical protein
MGTPFKRKGPKTIIGFKPLTSRFRKQKGQDIEVIDLTTETEIKLPKDFAVPSYKRKG